MMENQKKPPPSHILRSRGLPSERGNVGTEKGKNDEGRGNMRLWHETQYNFGKV